MKEVIPSPLDKQELDACTPRVSSFFDLACRVIAFFAVIRMLGEFLTRKQLMTGLLIMSFSCAALWATAKLLQARRQRH